MFGQFLSFLSGSIGWSNVYIYLALAPSFSGSDSTEASQISTSEMGFEDIWYSRPRKYGQGSRRW